MPKYIFFDIDTKLLEIYSATLSGLKDVEVINQRTDVRTLKNIDAFVSPANSYGWMNGGIDGIYSEMFPNVQKKVQNKIAETVGPTNNYHIPTLPIGMAVMVNVTNHIKLICAPTMFTPMNIEKKTDNIYHAMYAILEVCESLPSTARVAIPGMGTGVGGLKAEVSANQIRKAFVDYGL